MREPKSVWTFRIVGSAWEIFLIGVGIAWPDGHNILRRTLNRKYPCIVQCLSSRVQMAGNFQPHPISESPQNVLPGSLD